MKQKPYDAESNDKQSVVAEPALTYGNIEATRVARPVGNFVLWSTNTMKIYKVEIDSSARENISDITQYKTRHNHHDYALFVFLSLADYSSSKSSFPTPQSGQVQSSGKSSNAVPGAILPSGSPAVGS